MRTIKFACLLSIGVFLANILVAQQTRLAPRALARPDRQAQLEGLTRTWYRYWDKDYLITYGTDGLPDGSPTKPSIVLYDRDGQIVREAFVWFKDAYSVGINDVAINRNGELVVAGGTENEAGVVANFIGLVGKDNHIGQLIRTTPFIPVHVCVGEDGTVWSYGVDRDDQGKRIESSSMLRHYSFSKGQLGAMLDKSALNASGWTLTDGRYPGEITLRCTSRQVGLFNAASGEWIQVDLATNTLKISEVNALPSPKEMRITGFALTEAGDVFVSLNDRVSKPPRSGVFRLELDSAGVGSWVAVDNTIGPYLHGGAVERLLGTDGTELIYTKDLSGTAHWSKVAK